MMKSVYNCDNIKILCDYFIGGGRFVFVYDMIYYKIFKGGNMKKVLVGLILVSSVSVSVFAGEYICKFHCVGQWDSWRGGEQKVKGYGSYSGEAESWVKENYNSQCAKNFPFYKGGGGSASVGKVSCN